MDGDGGMEDDEMEVGMRERSKTWHCSRVNYVDTFIHFDTITEKAKASGEDDIKGKDDGSLAKPSNLSHSLSPLELLPTSSKKNTSRKNAWGDASYADMITWAIESTPDQRMTLTQIYKWLINNNDYFQQRSDGPASMGWKNSIRHNLSLHPQFCRVQKEGAGKSSWWTVEKDLLKIKPPRRRATMGDPLLLNKKRAKVNRKLRMLSSEGGEQEGTETKKKHMSLDAETEHRLSFSLFKTEMDNKSSEGQKIFLKRQSPTSHFNSPVDSPATTASFVVCSSLPLTSSTFLVPLTFTQPPTLQLPSLQPPTSNNSTDNQPIIYCVPANIEGQLINQLVLSEQAVSQAGSTSQSCQPSQPIFVQQQQLPKLQQQPVFTLNNNNTLLSNFQSSTNALLEQSPSNNQSTSPNNNHPLLTSNFQNLNLNNSNKNTTQQQNNVKNNSQQQDCNNTQQQKAQHNKTYNLPEKRKRLLLRLLHSQKFCQIRRDNPALNQRIIGILHKKKQLLNNNNDNENDDNNINTNNDINISDSDSTDTDNRNSNNNIAININNAGGSNFIDVNNGLLLNSPNSPLNSSPLHKPSSLSSSPHQPSPLALPFHQASPLSSFLHQPSPLSSSPQQHQLSSQQQQQLQQQQLQQPQTTSNNSTLSASSHYQSLFQPQSNQASTLESVPLLADRSYQGHKPPLPPPPLHSNHNLDGLILKQLELDDGYKEEEQQQLNYINEIISERLDEHILNNINLNNNNNNNTSSNFSLNNNNNNSDLTNKMDLSNNILDINNSNNNNNNNNVDNAAFDDVTLMTSLDEQSLLEDMDIFQCLLTDEEDNININNNNNNNIVDDITSDNDNIFIDAASPFHATNEHDSNNINNSINNYTNDTNENKNNNSNNYMKILNITNSDIVAGSNERQVL